MDRGSDCPKVIATTHFHDVFHGDLLSPYKLPISFVHMQVLLAPEADVLPGDRTYNREDDEDPVALTRGDKITYLYKCVTFSSEQNAISIDFLRRVTLGYSLHSHAITCAELFGVPKRVTSRAMYVR